MDRQLIVTSDGSYTIAIKGTDITYHSVHGAIQESTHVFINAGFHYCIDTLVLNSGKVLSILEMGFGTGLNALLTATDAANHNVAVYYKTLELFPLTAEEAKQLNYAALLDERQWTEDLFIQMHEAEWNKDVLLSKHPFTLHKVRNSLLSFNAVQSFHLVYFDAFAPAEQPELWTVSVFKKMYDLLYPGGVLVTYCSKGDVRRAMLAAGFKVEKLAGPPGKREMLRAIRPAD